MDHFIVEAERHIPVHIVAIGCCPSRYSEYDEITKEEEVCWLVLCK
jgi:hypothetical protein